VAGLQAGPSWRVEAPAASSDQGAAGELYDDRGQPEGRCFQLETRGKTPAGDQPEAIAQVLEAFQEPSEGSRTSFVTLAGATGTGKTFVIANVLQEVQLPTLVMCHTKSLANQLARELRSFFPRNNVCVYLSPFEFYVPGRMAQQDGKTVYRSACAIVDEVVAKERERVLDAMRSKRRDTIVVASISALYASGCKDRVLSPEARESVTESVLRELEELRAEASDSEDESSRRLVRQVETDLALIKKHGWCPEIFDRYGALLPDDLGSRDTLLHHFKRAFGDDWMVVCDESHVLLPQLKGPAALRQKRGQALVEMGFRLPSVLRNGPVDQSSFLHDRCPSKVLFVSATPGKLETALAGGQLVKMVQRPTHILDPVVELRTMARRGWSSADIWMDMFQEVSKTVNEGHHAVVVCATTNDAQIVAKVLQKISRSYKRYKNIKASCIHCQHKPRERAELLSKFGKGELNVLVSINLLREGLDFPRIALVAVLNADREGFLRTSTALTQLAGRAARNADGKVILYGKRQSAAMVRCVAEADVRRRQQEEHNRAHGFRPVSVQYNNDAVDVVYSSDESASSATETGSGVGEEDSDWGGLQIEDLQILEEGGQLPPDEEEADDQREPGTRKQLMRMSEHELAKLVIAGNRTQRFPGVFGIGPVIAERILKEHSGLDGVFEAARTGTLDESYHVGEKVAGKVRKYTDRLKEDALQAITEFAFMMKFQGKEGPPDRSGALQSQVARWESPEGGDAPDGGREPPPPPAPPAPRAPREAKKAPPTAARGRRARSPPPARNK